MNPVRRFAQSRRMHRCRPNQDHAHEHELEGHHSALSKEILRAGLAVESPTLGVLEADYRKDMSVEEGVKLVQKAINSALQRDIASGNGIDVYVINEKGVKHVLTKLVDTGLPLSR